jgi:hypothetical protein
MPDLKALLHWNRGSSAYGPGLDLGGGRTLPPEDVLDGHSARLIAGRQHSLRTVPVQVRDLSAAINRMAPNLAPLADLAEEVAVAVPAVAPEPDFRRTLHEALERTHRQHTVQVALGTRQAAQAQSSHLTLALLITTAVLCSVAFFGWFTLWRSKRAHARAAGLC